MSKREFDCNNPTDQVTIANMHKITEATFNNGINNFFGAGAASVPPTVKTWQEMSDAMDGQDCMSMQWKLEMDENDTTNNNITLTVEPMTETVVNYSIALFKGVRQAYNAETFEFYKAKHNDNRYDIIFKALNAANELVYCGDLSDIHPR